MWKCRVRKLYSQLGTKPPSYFLIVYRHLPLFLLPTSTSADSRDDGVSTHQPRFPKHKPHHPPICLPHHPPALSLASSPRPPHHPFPPPPPHLPPPLSHDKLRHEDSSEDDSTLSELDSDDYEDITDSDPDVSDDNDEDDRDEQDGEETLDDEAAPTILDTRETLKRSLIDEPSDNQETDVDEGDETVDGKTMEVPLWNHGIMDPDSIPAETDGFLAQLENARIDQSHEGRIEATPPPDPEYIRQSREETSSTLRKALSVPHILSAEVAVYMAF